MNKIKLVLLLLFITVSPYVVTAQQVDWITTGGGGGNDGGLEIAVDGYGNNYTVGIITDGFSNYPRWGNDTLGSSLPNGVDAFIVKHDVQGNRKWVFSFGGNNTDFASDIGIIGDTSIVVVGGYRSTNMKIDTTNLPSSVGFEYRLFVALFDTSGQLQWFQTAETGNTFWSQFSNLYNPRVSINEDGDIFIVGPFRSQAVFGSTILTSSGTSINSSYVAKYSSSGVFQWAKSTTSGSTSNNTFGERIASDNSGNVFISGIYNGSVTIGSTTLSTNGSNDIYLAKYDTSGTPIWAKGYGSFSTDEALGLSIDKFNDVYMVGRFYSSIIFGSDTLTVGGSSNQWDCYLVKLDTGGVVDWAKQFGGYTGTYASQDYCYGIDTDNKGNIGVSGRYGGNLAVFGKDTISGGNSFRAIFHSLIDSTGEFIWTVTGTSSTFFNNQSNGIALDSSKNIYTTGVGDPPLVFNNEVWSTGAGFRDAYTLKLADCSEADTAEIYVGPVSEACDGDSIKLWSNNNPALEYRWLRNGFGVFLATDSTYEAYATDSYSLSINDEGCYDTSLAVSIKINPLPNVSISNFPSTCVGYSDFTLTEGSPSGGKYYGIGVLNDTTFSPSTSGNGSFNLKYVYTDTNSCSDSSNKNITVGGQTAYFFMSNTTFCANDPAVVLSGGIPTGGDFIGPGIYNGKFYPDSAGIGTHTLSYVFTNLGCNDTASNTVVVNAIPNVSFASLPDVCSSTFSLDLNSYVSPAGGSFSGTAVITNLFYPIISGAGTFSIRYIQSNAQCSDTAFSSIKVETPISATLSSISDYCIYDPSFSLSGGSPAGGVYSVNGMTSMTFNPANLGAGTHVVKYKVGNICGFDSATVNVNVNPQPTVTLSTFNDVCANSGNLTLTGGVPTGGTYFGNNISTGNFNPLSATAGTHTINYTYSDGNSCSDTASQTIEVDSVPVVSFSAISDVCIDNGLVTLTQGSPTGGFYTGTGISGTDFNPLTATVGTHTLSYKFTDGNTCSDSSTQTITVNDLPTITLSALSAVCVTESPFTLTNGTPSGGTYSGIGISSNTFNPSVADTGTHVITYTYTDGNGCTNLDSTTIRVNSQPTVTLSTFNDVCANSGNLTLTGGLPLGGTYFGSNISSGSFNPLSAGDGTHTINYTFSDGNSCSDTVSQAIEVDSVPVVTFSAISDVCIDNGLVALTQGSPTGGVYTGTGVSGTDFNPLTATVGTHTLSYKFTDANTCSDSASQSIKVDSITSVYFPYNQDTFLTCKNWGNNIGAIGRPSGGTHFGTYVSIVNGSYHFSGAPVGYHKIGYTFTNSFGCSDTGYYWFHVRANPVVTHTSSYTACQDDSITLSGGVPSGGYYFRGQFNDTVSNKFKAVTIGTYWSRSYVYFDSNKCYSVVPIYVTVNPKPTVSFSALNDVCIDNGLVALTQGSPTGGTYSGTGVSGTDFNPLTATVGTHTLSYKYTNANTCSDSATQTITVNDLPTITLSALSPICVTESPFTLTNGIPTGGTYSGVGVSSNTFNPSVADTGTHVITYTYTDGNGCTNIDTTSIRVNPQPTVTLSTFNDVCANSGNLTLTGGLPLGGTYFGSNITTGSFNPLSAGDGTHTINYTFSDGNSCSDTANQTIEVDSVPVVTFSAISDVCIDNGLVALTQGSPTGGVYTGTGVSGTDFNPLTATVGTHTLSYKYSDANTCSDSATQTITVNDLPTITLSALSPICVTESPFTLTNGTPNGGAYNGVGVNSNTFNPSIADTGTHVITYTYTDGNGCTNSDSTSIRVNPQPTVTLSSFSNLCANSGNLTLTGGLPMGGSYFGSNISSGQFDPLSATAGAHTINYTYSGGNSCSDTASQTIEVDSVPVVTFSAISDVCIDNGLVTLTQGSPAGGTYLGTGVSGTDFNPLTATVGTHTLSYKFTDGNTCSDSSTQTITVNDLPTITLSALSAVCVTESPFTLINGTPSGGMYSGVGVSSNTFNPSVADTGTHIITYTYTDGNGCTNSDSTSIRVNPQPTVTLSTFNDVCANSGNLTLTGGLPTGGTYFGNNISSGQFDPLSATAGTHTINYTFSDGNSCSDTASQTIEVDSVPVVSFSAISDVCIDNGLVTLTQGSPTGGFYTGTGVSGTDFNPLTATVGTHTLSYKFTDGNTCSDSATQTITINDLPTITLSALSAVCVTESPFTLTNGSPSGGTYSGIGISSNTFNPSVADTGTHVITYTYTDGNGCTNGDSTSIRVNPQPTVTLSSFSNVCANSGNLTLTGGLPTGGTYFGNNISSGQFDPVTAGAGTHTINYTYIDGNSCSDTTSQTIEVDSVPVVSLSTFSNLCSNSDSITLTGGTPLGGDYSINGSLIAGFSPNSHASGSHLIWYSFTDGNSCTDSVSRNLIVDTVTTLSFSPLSNICANDTLKNIDKALPKGGLYSGLGIVNDTLFDPSIPGGGIHTIKYIFTNSYNCSDSINQSITVDTIPIVSFILTQDSICANADSLFLIGTPSGGIFTGNGVQGNYINPSLLNSGYHFIEYNVTNTLGCTNSIIDSIRLDSVPALSMTFQDSICSNALPINLLNQGSPSGGVYSINGVSSTIYSPKNSSNTMDTIGYSFANNYGCSDSIYSIIRVDSITPLVQNPLPLVCSADTISLNHILPMGGIYSGNGIDTGVFISKNVAGEFPYKYEFTNLFGCTDSVIDTINVQASPVALMSPLGVICNNTPDFILKNGTPVGGVYIGSMVRLDSTFNSAGVQAGSYNLKYAVSDSNGCVDTASISINIDTVPSVSMATGPSLCSNAGLFKLTQGLPAGGTYSGLGVIQDSLFNPSIGFGNYNLKYSFTDLNGCSDSSFSSVGVDTLLKIDSLYFADLCAYGDTIVLNSGFPQGGRYFGLGVYDDTMYVAKNENSGIDTLSYVLESACGSDTMSIEYNLNGLPLVTIDSIKRLCVGPNPHLLKEGLPVGGNYFIDGKLDSLIGLTQSGTKTVSYRFIDSLGCEGSAFQEIEVNDNPSLNLTGFTPKLCSDLDSFQLDFGDAIEKTIWNGDTGIALVNLPVNQLAYGKNLIDVSAMNYRGCKSDTTLRLELVNCGDLISVWPNPSDGEFQIIFESGIEQEVTLVVLSSVGQRVLDTKLSLKPGRNVYDAFLDLGAGTYIVHVFIGEDDYWDKIVIR